MSVQTDRLDQKIRLVFLIVFAAIAVGLIVATIIVVCVVPRVGAQSGPASGAGVFLSTPPTATAMPSPSASPTGVAPGSPVRVWEQMSGRVGDERELARLSDSAQRLAVEVATEVVRADAGETRQARLARLARVLEKDGQTEVAFPVVDGHGESVAARQGLDLGVTGAGEQAIGAVPVVGVRVPVTYTVAGAQSGARSEGRMTLIVVVPTSGVGRALDVHVEKQEM